MFVNTLYLILTENFAAAHEQIKSISSKTIACRELSRIYLANLQHGPFYVTKFRIGKPKCLWNVNDIIGMILGKGVALCHRSSDALKLSLINIQSRLISILFLRFTKTDSASLT